MEREPSNRESHKTLMSLIGILAVLFFLHRRGQVEDAVGRGIREGEAWFVLFLLWGFAVCGVAAFLSNFGVLVDLRLLSGVGMLPLFLGLLRFLWADRSVLRLGLVLVGIALLIRLLIHLFTGEPF